MLEGHARALDLAPPRLAAQLPGQLGTLREPGRADRMALRDQPPARVHDPASAVGGRAGVDQLAALAGRAEVETFVA